MEPLLSSGTKKSLFGDIPTTGGAHGHKNEKPFHATNTPRPIFSPHKRSSWPLFFSGLLLGFFVYGFFFDQERSFTFIQNLRTSAFGSPEVSVPSDSVPGQNKKVFEKTFLPVVPGENVIVANNQPMGDHVLVSMVLLVEDGWLAIHDIDSDGKPGNILGARRFVSGRYFAEKIDLLRDTQEGSSYTVVLHADDGDNVFDYAIEVPRVDTGGDFVSTEFTATSRQNY